MTDETATAPAVTGRHKKAFDRIDSDLVELASLVARGLATAEELLESARIRLDLLNPAINAVISTFDPPCLDDPSARGPLHGVPFLLKDAFAWMKDKPTTNGSALLANAVKARNSVLVERLLQAGLSIFGKTNCPEFNSLGTTEPVFFGATRNPWDPRYSAGGSSGGSAAAVAARIVPAAHGSDGAGSIRIPASNCGLVGLKPSRGRITLAPVLGESINGCMSEGVVSLSVRDTAALLDVMEGPSPGDPYFAPRPLEPYRQVMLRAPGPLRIAFTDQSLIGTSVHPECRDAVAHARDLCRRLGHEMLAKTPPVDARRYNETYRRIWPVNVARSIYRLRSEWSLDQILERIEPFNRHLVALAASESAVDLAHSIEWMQSVGRDFAEWMDDEDVDVWLTPTLGLPPTRLGYFDARDSGGAKVMDRFIAQTAFTTLANMTGQPAISLPLFTGDGALPIGVQFTARYGHEDLLLQLARQLEEASPWIGRHPPLLQHTLARRSEHS